jgi:hypothetical protein
MEGKVALQVHVPQDVAGRLDQLRQLRQAWGEGEHRHEDILARAIAEHVGWELRSLIFRMEEARAVGLSKYRSHYIKQVAIVTGREHGREWRIGLSYRLVSHYLPDHRARFQAVAAIFGDEAVRGFEFGQELIDRGLPGPKELRVMSDSRRRSTSIAHGWSVSPTASAPSRPRPMSSPPFATPSITALPYFPW